MQSCSVKKVYIISQSGLWEFVLWEHEISASLQFWCGMKLWNSATDAKCRRGVVSANPCLLVEFESYPDINWEEYNDENLISFRWSRSKCHSDSTRLQTIGAGASYLCFKMKAAVTVFSEGSDYLCVGILSPPDKWHPYYALGPALLGFWSRAAASPEQGPRQKRDHWENWGTEKKEKANHWAWVCRPRLGLKF